MICSGPGKIAMSRIFALMLILLLSLAACSNPQGIGSLTEEDNGKTITLNFGDTLPVRLQGNPSTGYTWEPANADLKILTIVGEPEFIAQNPGTTGSGGIVTLRFKATATGQESLKLIYHRSWEKDVAPLKTFEITVVVQ
jgi:inhibitor of cysteine peptidase